MTNTEKMHLQLLVDLRFVMYKDEDVNVYMVINNELSEVLEFYSQKYRDHKYIMKMDSYDVESTLEEFCADKGVGFQPNACFYAKTSSGKYHSSRMKEYLGLKHE